MFAHDPTIRDLLDDVNMDQLRTSQRVTLDIDSDDFAAANPFSVIFDDRTGDVRFLSDTEAERAAARIPRGADNVDTPRRHSNDEGEPTAFAMTPLAVHEAHGHLDISKSRIKGMPFPRDGCPLCPYGKIKKKNIDFPKPK